MEHIRGLSIPRSLAEAAANEPLALIVYDMQVGIVDQIPGGADVVAGSQRCSISADGPG
jgi:biuret amidohydrolase